MMRNEKLSASDEVDDLDLLIRLFLAQQPVLDLFDDTNLAASRRIPRRDVLKGCRDPRDPALLRTTRKPRVPRRALQCETEGSVPIGPPEHAALYKMKSLPNIPEICRHEPATVHAAYQGLEQKGFEDRSPKTIPNVGKDLPATLPLNIRKKVVAPKDPILKYSQVRPLRAIKELRLEETDHHKLRGRTNSIDQLLDVETVEDFPKKQKKQVRPGDRDIRSPLSILSALTLVPMHKDASHLMLVTNDSCPDLHGLFQWLGRSEGRRLENY